MVLKQSSEIPWDPLQQNAGLQTTCGNNSIEVQKRSVTPEGYGCKGYWTKPSLPAVSNCGAQSAERGNASHIGNAPIDTMRFMLYLPPMQTRQKVKLVKAYFRKPTCLSGMPRWAGHGSWCDPWGELVTENKYRWCQSLITTGTIRRVQRRKIQREKEKKHTSKHY